MEAAFDAFSTSIAISGKINDLTRKFIQYRKDGSTDNMFKYIYNMEEAHKFLKISKTKVSKNDGLSTKLREEGNVFFKGKKLKEALEKYNECIFYAPHPELSYEEKDKDQYTQLSLGYGNRSAVLFQLKEYKICICDIDRSLFLCNSKITQLKLKERKVKCLIAINKYNEAQELLKHCKSLLNTLELEEKVKESYNSSLSKLSQQSSDEIRNGPCQTKKHKNKYEEIKNADTSMQISINDLIFAYTNPTPPSLDDKPNPNIPAFSCALKLEYSPDQGRYVVAARNIKPGEVIGVETAYVSCIKTEKKNSSLAYCTFCLARCAVPLPCVECTNVVFCSEECRSEGWDKFHRIECPVYSRLQEIEIDLAQAYRMVTGQNFKQLKAIVSQIKKDKQKSPLEQILNEDQICESDSYRGIYFLEGNIKKMDMEKLINFSTKAFMMTQLLIHSNRYFLTKEGDEYLPNEEDILIIGSLFIRHFLGVCCNSFALSETNVIPKKKQISDEGYFGTGTYIAGSLFNHSCIPSAMMSNYGNIGVFRACRFIPSGSRVSVCYSHEYLGQPDREIRQRNFSDNDYSFICKCEACEKDFKFELPDLKVIFTCSRLRPKETRIPRNDFEETSNLKLELDNLVKRNHSMTKMLFSPNFVVKCYLDLALETIEFFDRYVVTPNPLYIHMKIVLGEILRRDGSCYFTMETKQKSSMDLGDFNFWLRLLFISNFQYPSKDESFKQYDKFLSSFSN